MEELPQTASEGPELRAVAKLNRKRATDRRAQRAARQRQQEYIDSLLRQIEHLSGLPHDRAQDLLQENERLRADNAVLRHGTTIPLDGRASDGDGHSLGLLTTVAVQRKSSAQQ